MSSSPSKQHELTDKQYEELGRLVANVYETGYLDAGKSFRMSFVKGLFQGLGAAIGATLLVAFVIWVLSLFTQIPVVGRFSETLRDSVQTTQQK